MGSTLTNFLWLLGIAVTLMGFYLTERRARRQEWVTQQDELERLFRENIADKLSGILDALKAQGDRLTSAERRLTDAEKRHERLLGRLEGARVLPESE